MPKHNSSPYIQTLPEKLIHWYHEKGYAFPWRNNRNPYFVWVSEIMLQQTTVNTVVPYFLNFIKKFPTLEVLARSSLDQVLSQWQGLGYYRRAENLHKAALQVIKDFNGEFPNDIDDLRSLQGIGDYTAASISAIAFDAPYVPIDGNVRRVFSRFFGIENCEKTLKVYAKTLEEILKIQSLSSRFFAEALMDLGREICDPKKPLCENCPINSGCKAFLEQKQNHYLPKSKTVLQPIKYAKAFIIRKDTSILLEKRTNHNILKGLWQVPLTEFVVTKEEQTPTSQEVFLGTIKHVFSHFKLFVDVYQKDNRAHHQIENQRFVSMDEIEFYALPKLVQKIIGLSDFYHQRSA